MKLGLIYTPNDEIDLWPATRRVRTAGTWGIYKPGLRHAQPFDGLMA